MKIRTVVFGFALVASVLTAEPTLAERTLSELWQEIARVKGEAEQARDRDKRSPVLAMPELEMMNEAMIRLTQVQEVAYDTEAQGLTEDEKLAMNYYVSAADGFLLAQMQLAPEHRCIDHYRPVSLEWITEDWQQSLDETRKEDPDSWKKIEAVVSMDSLTESFTWLTWVEVRNRAVAECYRWLRTGEREQTSDGNMSP